jgi:phage tail-like protein
VADTSARNDPFLAYRFEIRLDDLSGGGFSECTGLQLETEVFDYPEGGLNTHLHRFPTRTRQSNLVLKHGIVDRELWDWYFALTQGAIRYRNGAILVREPSGGQVVLEWQFRQAFPCKWQGPDLNATQSSVAVETLELCHQGLERRQ